VAGAGEDSGFRRFGVIARRYLLHFDKKVFEDIEDNHAYKKYIDAMFVHGLSVGYNVNGKRFYNPENRSAARSSRCF